MSALHGLESSDDSQGVEEHHDDPVHVCDLDVSDYDGYPESPPSGAKDNKVKKKRLTTLPLGGVQYLLP